MRFKWLSDYWLGVLLAVSASVASLWLGIIGKLTLYIHPRYILFTVILNAIALAAILAGFAVRAHKRAWFEKKSLAAILMGTICLVICIGLLVTKPSALTSSAAGQRGINSAGLDIASRSAVSMQLPSNIDYSAFTVKEWASLLSQTNDPSYFEGKKVDVIGFISPAESSPDIFYVSRFVLTCCAVDARPIGVPVYYPNWKTIYGSDQWVRVQGGFVRNQEDTTQPNVVEPQSIVKTNQPEDPYVH